MTGRADRDGAEAGHLAGLRESGPARLAPDGGESVYHHAGYLSGHLTRWMADRGRPVDPAMQLVVAAYAAAIADSAGQSSLAKPDGLVVTHTYAAIRTEKSTGTALSAADERMIFGWLVEQAGAEPTRALVDKLERLRRRRHERTGH